MHFEWKQLCTSTFHVRFDWAWKRKALERANECTFQPQMPISHVFRLILIRIIENNLINTRYRIGSFWPFGGQNEPYRFPKSLLPALLDTHFFPLNLVLRFCLHDTATQICRFVRCERCTTMYTPFEYQITTCVSFGLIRFRRTHSHNKHIYKCMCMSMCDHQSAVSIQNKWKHDGQHNGCKRVRPKQLLRSSCFMQATKYNAVNDYC